KRREGLSVDAAGAVEEEIFQRENGPAVDRTGTHTNARQDIVADFCRTPVWIRDRDEAVARVGKRSSGEQQAHGRAQDSYRHRGDETPELHRDPRCILRGTRAICWTAFVVSGPRWVGCLMERTADCRERMTSRVGDVLRICAAPHGAMLQHGPVITGPCC